MSSYAVVENGQVVRTTSLPRNYQNITGFNKLSNEKLKVYGFYPYTYTAPSVDYLTEKLGDEVFTINSDSVSGTRAVLSKDPSELIETLHGITSGIALELPQLLYDTDWIFLNDANLSEPQQQAYVDLRSDIASMMSTLDSFETDVLEDLQDLSNKISECKACMCSRFQDFSAPMIALRDSLAGLLTE